jgi:hypothetical protein
VLPKGAGIFQHLILRKKQLHVVMNGDVAALSEPEKDSCRQEQESDDWKEKPVFCYPDKPFLLKQSTHVVFPTMVF